MRYLTFSWQSALALILCLAALFSLPLLTEAAPAPFSSQTTTLVILLVAAAAILSLTALPLLYSATVLLLASFDAAWLLFDQALLVEGLPVANPGTFVQRLNRVLGRAV